MAVTTFGGNQSIGEDNFKIELAADDDAGEWFDSAGIVDASLDIRDLESDGSLKIHCSNNPQKPSLDDDGTEKQTIAGASGNQLIAATAPYSLWKKISKIAGMTSTLTTVYFAGKRSS